ncbi:MAG: hypothetical protein KGH53_01905 [Candidatus Micrarchaeota archaeon]|nr:hypothetical protein [Candidatus Micrarchaeota archaeon]
MSASTIDIEKGDKLFGEIKKLLAQELGGNKYALILAYETGKGIDEKTGRLNEHVLAHTITNLEMYSPLISWKGILSLLTNRLSVLRQAYQSES